MPKTPEKEVDTGTYNVAIKENLIPSIYYCFS
jgi:hypothetical protein